MTEQPQTPEPPPAPVEEPSGWTPVQSPAQTDGSPLQQLGGLADERPELAVGAAFAGGFLAALIIKRLAR